MTRPDGWDEWNDWESNHLEITMDHIHGPVIGWLHSYRHGLVVGCADCQWESPVPGSEDAIQALMAHRSISTESPEPGDWPH